MTGFRVVARDGEGVIRNLTNELDYVGAAVLARLMIGKGLQAEIVVSTKSLAVRAAEIGETQVKQVLVVIDGQCGCPECLAKAAAAQIAGPQAVAESEPAKPVELGPLTIATVPPAALEQRLDLAENVSGETSRRRAARRRWRAFWIGALRLLLGARRRDLQRREDEACRGR